jgi:HPt (histidine-containing phosphotransfer) domain-containing protein
MELDLDHLLVMAGQDIDLADEVLSIFETHADTWGRMLRSEIPQADWADAVHTLKGAALSLGASDLAALCAEAEALGRGSEDVSRVRAATILTDVRDTLNQTLEACARARHKLSRPGLRESKDSNS